MHDSRKKEFEPFLRALETIIQSIAKGNGRNLITGESHSVDQVLHLKVNNIFKLWSLRWLSRFHYQMTSPCFLTLLCTRALHYRQQTHLCMLTTRFPQVHIRSQVHPAHTPPYMLFQISVYTCTAWAPSQTLS